MARHFRILYLWILACSCTSAYQTNNSYIRFHSRPDLKAPKLKTINYSGNYSQEYLFLSPFSEDSKTYDSGAYIFGTNGELVWSGLDDTGGAGRSDIQGLHVCTYQSTDHLCYWSGQQRGMHGSGLGVVMNSNYQIVKTIRSPSAAASVDLHEFRLTERGTALFTTYKPILSDSIWVLDSAFEEIDVADGSLLFEWSSINHIPARSSRVSVGSYPLVGSGESPDRAWDYLHINSIDWDSNGNYLISARHLDALFLVSKTDGSILWQLGGDNSDFTLQNFTFRRQHHARFREQSNSWAVITLFDNDSDGFTVTGSTSTGLLIHVDFRSRSAYLLQSYRYPGANPTVTPGMGSLDILTNGNILLSWGKGAQVAEYRPDATPVWAAYIGSDSWNYRTSRHIWRGYPKQRPALWTYAKNTTSSMTIYASWNGATEVDRWRFFASHKQNGPFDLIGEVRKDGFETSLTTAKYYTWTLVEAMRTNRSLAESPKTRTFVPDQSIEDRCDLEGCDWDSPPNARVSHWRGSAAGESWTSAQTSLPHSPSKACLAQPKRGMVFVDYAQTFCSVLVLILACFSAKGQVSRTGRWSLSTS